MSLKDNPLVSVVVPVYNMEKFLTSCLESIVEQNYRHLEILVVDDGSSDGSKEIAHKFAIRDGRIRVIIKDNGGVSSARNLGMSHAQGEYIAFVDADDMIHRTYVSVLVNDLIITKSDVATSRKHMSYIDQSEFMSKNIDSEAEDFSEYDSESALISLYNGTLEKGQNGCQVFRAALLKDNSILYDSSMAIGEDFDFFARSILVSNKIVIDHRDMYFYRRNDDSAVHKPFNLKQFEAIYNIQKAGRSVQDDFPALKKVLDSNLLITSVSYGALMYTDRKKFPKEYLQIKTNIKKYRYSTLFSSGLKLTSRVKALLVTVLGTELGLRVVKMMIKL